MNKTKGVYIKDNDIAYNQLKEFELTLEFVKDLVSSADYYNSMLVKLLNIKKDVLENKTKLYPNNKIVIMSENCDIKLDINNEEILKILEEKIETYKMYYINNITHLAVCPINIKIDLTEETKELEEEILRIEKTGILTSELNEIQKMNLFGDTKTGIK